MTNRQTGYLADLGYLPFLHKLGRPGRFCCFQLFLVIASLCFVSSLYAADWNICSDTSSTDATGTIYDSGGAGGNYGNMENCSFLISPSGSPAQITLSFSAFNVESNWDELRVYDGTNQFGTLLGAFDGFSLPGDVIATSGSIYLSFTSDFSGNYSGFAATWTSSGSDSTAPATVTDLATSAATSSSITLDWTAPGDDGSSGTGNSYDVRYSTSSINDANWAGATPATGEPSPQVAGSAESFVVTGLDPSTTYYFAIKTSDEAANESGLSNIASGTTAASGSGSDWNICSDTSSTDATGTLYDSGGAGGNYGNLEDCSFLISPSSGTGIELSIPDPYILDGDLLEIYEGSDESGDLIYSITNEAGFVNRTANFGFRTDIFIKFTSGPFHTASGFRVEWNVTHSAISGTIFEDANYGGGPGRSQAASAGIGRPNVTIELYNNSGTYISNTTTDGSGNYSFTGLSEVLYRVRVVNSTVTSSRSGATGTEVAVQTFRADGDGEAAGTGTIRVGGEQPQSIDAPANSGAQSLADLQSPGGQYTQSLVTVDSSSGDVSDVDFGFNFDTIVNTNDSGQGSLRQFIVNANIFNGTQTSQFNIAGGGPHVIALLSLLPWIDDSVNIDGTTEPDYATNGNRPIVVIDGNGLTDDCFVLGTNSDNSVIRGLVIRDFHGSQAMEIKSGVSGITIAGNYLGSFNTDGSDAGVDEAITGDAIIYIRGDNNTIGGNRSADINVISGSSSGVIMDGAAATGNQVSGNYFGTNSLGSAIGAGFSDSAIRIQSSATGNTIGGATSAEGNVIAGAGFSGIFIGGETSDGNVIQNNLVGISADGTSNLGNSNNGIRINNGADGTVISGNVVGGSGDEGIQVYGASSGTVIQGNIVGSDPTETLNWGNAGNGILLENGATDNTVGGVNSGEGNTVAYSGQVGVNIAGSASTGNSIIGNLIYSNGGIGIDLSNDGADSNDAGDVDTGANDLLNYPEITSATETGGTISIDFDLDVPAGNYRIEFFKNPSGADPSGYGEGESFADTVNINHPGGAQSFSHSLSGAVGDIITATATVDAGGDDYGSTSEFSATYAATDPPPDISLTRSVDLVSDPFNNLTNPKMIPGAVLTYTVTVTNQGLGATDADTVIITNPVGSENVLFVGDLAGAGSGPADFSDGSTASGLTYSFDSLASVTDTISFSNDNGATYTYTPTPDGDGYDASVTHLRVTPVGAFAASDGSNHPNFNFIFKVKVQ